MLDQTPDATLDTILGRLNDALERGDAAAAAALFQADSYWRDLVAFTWNLRTMEGPDQIRAAHFTPIDDVSSAVLTALAQAGPASTLCVLPQGPQTIPYLPD